MLPHPDKALREVMLQATGQPADHIDCKGAVTIMGIAKADGNLQSINVLGVLSKAAFLGKPKSA
jgi:hypothetical protein